MTLKLISIQFNFKLIFVAVIKVTVAIMQLEISGTLLQVKISAANMWVTIFIEIMHERVCCNHAAGNLYSALCT